MSSSKLVTCPSCQKRFRAKQELVGKKIRCPNCRNAILIPPDSSGDSVSRGKAKKSPNEGVANSKSTVSQSGKRLPPKRSKSRKQSKARKPSNKGVVIGLSSLVVILLAVGGYFGLQLFQSSSDNSNVAFSESADAASEGRRNVVAGQGGSNKVHRVSLLEYLPDNLEECLIRGPASRIEDGGVTLGDSDKETFLEIPVVLPEEYELEFSVRRETESGCLVVCVPHKGFPVAVVFDAEHGSGIGAIDGKYYGDNMTTVTETQFVSNQTRRIRILSSADGLLVNMDGERLMEFTGAPERLVLNHHHPNRLFPALETLYNGSFVVEESTVQVTGLHPPQAAIPPFPRSEASIALAEEAFGPAFRDVVALSEKIGGHIEIQAANAEGQRLDFNVQARDGSLKWVSVAGVDFTPLGRIQGPVAFAAPATTHWPEATLPEFNPKFRLEFLEFHVAKDLTGAVLARFPGEHITWISLHQTKLGEDAADAISRMKSLKLAHMLGVEIGEKNATALASLPSLEVLGISSHLTSDASIEKLAQSQSIQELIVVNGDKDSVSLSDAALSNLEKMPSLRKLKLEKTGITQQAVDQFRQSKPNVDLAFTPGNRVAMGNTGTGSNTAESDVYTIQTDQTVPILELIEQYPQDKSFFEQRLQRAQKEIEARAASKRGGHIVVGRVKLEDGDNPASVDAQVNLSNNGFFASAIRDANKPMGFQAHRYQPLDLIAAEHAKPNGDGIYDVGVVQMTKAPPEQRGSIVGKIQLEGSGATGGTRVSLGFSTRHINSMSGGTEGSGRHVFSLSAGTQNDGTFAFEGLSEGSYYVYFSNAGFVSTFRKLQVERGEATDIGTIALDRKRDIEIEYVVERNPVQSFNLNQKQTVVVKTGEPFKSREDIYGHDLQFETKSNKLQFRSSYGPCSIMHLGEGLLSDYQDVDISKFKGAHPSSIEPQVGHVYLLNQGAWKHQVLFRIKSLEENNKQAQPPRAKMQEPAETVSKSASSPLGESKDGKFKMPTRSDLSITEKFQGKVLGARFSLESHPNADPMFNLYLDGSDAEKAEGYGFIESFTASAGNKSFEITNRDQLKKSWLSFRRNRKGDRAPTKEASGIPHDAVHTNFRTVIADAHETMPDHIDKVTGNMCLFVAVERHDIVVENFMSHMGKELDYPDLKEAGMRLSLAIKDIDLYANRPNMAYKARHLEITWEDPKLSGTEIRLAAFGLKPGPCSLDVLSQSDDVLSEGRFFTPYSEQPPKSARCVLTFDPDYKIPSDAKLRIRFVSEVKIVEVPFSLKNVPVFVGEKPKSEFDAERNNTDSGSEDKDPAKQQMERPTTNVPGTPLKPQTDSSRDQEVKLDRNAEADFREFLTKHKVPIRNDIIAALQEAQQRAEGVEKGHVVIGQVDLPSNCSLNDLVCQGVVLADGYFVDAVQTPGVPIWFWHPRCAFAESIPQSNERDIEWLGQIPLKNDNRRAAFQGIARAHQFAVPENLKLKAEYSPGFVNSIGSEGEKLETLTARLMEIAEPAVEVNQQTGEFRMSGLLNAPVQVELAGEGSEQYSTVIHPSMDTTLDLGICDLYRETGFKRLPDLDSLDMAEDGRPKLERLLEQIREKSGTSPEAVRFVEGVTVRLSSCVQRAEDWIEKNGERSAVALIIPVAIPGTDLSELKSNLSGMQAVYASPGTDTPRILFDPVKPGTIVRIALAGHETFEYQVRGSRDGVEVIEPTFKPLGRRDNGSARGRVTRGGGSRGGVFGLHLLANAWPHVRPNGWEEYKPQTVNVFADGRFSPDPLWSSTTTGQLELPKLPSGPYTLSIWGASGEWPRQIRFSIEPGQRITLPQVALYQIPPVQFESLHAFRAKSERRSLLDAKIDQYTQEFAANRQSAQIRIEPKRLRIARSKNGESNEVGMGFGGVGDLNWNVDSSGGNALVFQPRINAGFSVFGEQWSEGWSVLRLGTADTSAYQSIDLEFGEAFDLNDRAFPERPQLQHGTFQLARGYTYLAQHSQAGYAILVKVR